MPFFIDDFSLPPSRRQPNNPVAPKAPTVPVGARDPGEFQIIILMPNDPAGQDLAIRLFRAIKLAQRTWQSMATLVGVVVNAVTAVGGNVIGPPLNPLILVNVPGKNPAEQKIIAATASVMGSAWIGYTATIRVPGLPWYPAFAAVPSPIAPPTPNVPSPVVALTQVAAILSPAVLKPQIMAQLAPDRSAEKIIDAVLVAYSQFFTMWQVTTLVTNVLGTGPVPTFAPPYVPVGPVIGGVGTMLPGGFV